MGAAFVATQCVATMGLRAFPRCRSTPTVRPAAQCTAARPASARLHRADRYNRALPPQPSCVRRGQAERHDQVRVRHRRRGVLLGQGHRVGVAGRDPGVARPQSHPDQARSLPQRRPGHDEPVPARRGVRHRRRRRDRPRPRPLRALHLDPDEAQQQLHHRPDLQERARKGASRRLPRQDGAGDPARHQRDPGFHPPRRRRRHRRRGPGGDLRGRRHGGRHRVAAVPRGGAPAEPEARPHATPRSCT